MIFRRLYFTILELLIVIAILGIAGGFIAINVRKAVFEQNFRSEVEIIVNQLRLAQDLMLIFRGEVSVKFKTSEDESEAYCYLEFAAEMPKNWAKEAKRLHKLKYVHRINFQDQNQLEGLQTSPDDERTIIVRFFSNGSTMSKGIMELSSVSSYDSDGAIKRYINLPGHPAPIVSSNSFGEAMALSRDEEAFNLDLTRQTAAEVQFIKEKAASAVTATTEKKKKK